LEKPLRTVFTDNKGQFQFTKADTGRFVVFASNAGFAEKQSAPFLVDKDTKVIEVPVLLLAISTESLASVTVSARRPLIEQSDEKLTYNAEADASVEGQTATDVLRKTPFLTVDGDGNVQLNGQSNFKVLLNGKETAMFTRNLKDALQSFPANLIKKVEVITSPSSKYDGEGVGGIINIITKKKVMGYNGSVGISRNLQLQRTNANMNMNFKYGKFGFTGYYGLGTTDGLKFRNASETESFNPIAFYKRSSSGDRTIKNFFNYGNLELSLDIDSLNTLSAYANLNGGSNRNEFIRQFDVIKPDKSDTLRSIYYDNNRFQWPSFNWGMDYIRKFRKPEQELTFKMFHENGTDDGLQESNQFNPDYNRFVVNDNNSGNRQSTWQADYIHPLKNNMKLEVGLKAIMREATANYESRLRYDESHDYQPDTANSDNFSYHQDVYSGYATYRFAIKKYSFRLGSRVERTVVNGDFVKSNSKVQQDYTTFLPTFFVSRKFGATNTLSLSYNKRLSRPYIWDLNPFVNNTDSFNVSFGNPHLAPEIYHAFELAYTAVKGKTNINIRLTETMSNTQITRFYTFDDPTGITTWTSDNIGSSSSTGLSGNITANLTSKWRVNSNLGLRYDFIKNRRNPAQRNSGFGGWANMNTSYEFSKQFNISANGNMWMSPVQIQGRYSNNYWYSVGGTYKVLKQKLSLSFNFANWFEKDFTWRNEFTDANFRTISHTYAPARSLNVSLRWNFGKLTDNVSRKRGVSNDDLRGRSE
ncbi:MAG TPA: outer membrane beta-barrel protein, partial [Chitinophagaceae bacterium]|nr:outer membrane beta-barrel protein [Chitinophagaceae bacterium]